MRCILYVVCLGLLSSCTEQVHKSVGLRDHAIFDPSGEYIHSSQSVFKTYVIPNASQPAAEASKQ